MNKRSGKLFHLGSAFPPERDLDLYDRGYQFERYDLVLLSVRDRAQTLRALGELRLSVVEPKEEHGVVWRIPREFATAELSQKLDQLPCTIPAVKLYFVAEVLENARRAGWFTFEIQEHVPPPSPRRVEACEHEANLVDGAADDVAAESGDVAVYRGMTYEEAGVVQDQALNAARVRANQALNPGAAGSGAYITSQEATAAHYAELAGLQGRGLGPAVVRMDVPTARFNAFARQRGISLENPARTVPWRN